MTPKPQVLHRFRQLSAYLHERGFPETSPWWMRAIEAWYLSGKTQAVFRVGRRGGKSSTLSRLAVCEALYGGHKVPPGDVGVVAIISTRKEEALERLRTIRAILDALKVKYRERDMTIELVGRPVIFRVYVATIAGVSGFTAIFVLCDEVAKWKDLDSGVNPAAEVIGSVRPTLATQPGGRIVLSSSPLGVHDAHFDAYRTGPNDLQVIDYATTWEANPTITQAFTRTLEPDETRWLREYKAVPQEDSDSSLLSAALLSKAERDSFTDEDETDPWQLQRYRYVATMDPATRGNAWTFTVGRQDERGVRQVVFAKQWIGSRSKPLVPGNVFTEMTTLLKPFNLQNVWSDQYAGDALREIALQKGIYVNIEPWHKALKDDACEGLRSLLQEKKLELVKDPVLRSDLLGIKQRIGRSGVSYDYDEVDGRHSDYAPSTAMLVWKLRIRGLPKTRELSEKERHDVWKSKFLIEREKARKADEKHGPLPASHRMLPRAGHRCIV